MEVDSNLEAFLRGKNSAILYGEFFAKKLLILGNGVAFCFENDAIFEWRSDKSGDFGSFIATNSTNLFERLKAQIDEVRGNLAHYQHLIERKENAILKGKSVEKFFQKSFVLKQKLNKSLNFCAQAGESLTLLANEQTFLKKNLRIYAYATKALEKSAKELITRLDGLYALISSIKNERLNQNIYILSIISTIVLPLNLIVGFFGMNTGGLFLQNSAFGTLIVLGIIIAVFALGALYYRLKTLKIRQDLSLEADFGVKNNILANANGGHL